MKGERSTSYRSFLEQKFKGDGPPLILPIIIISYKKYNRSSEENNQPPISENKNVQNTEISSFRIIVSQCAAIFPITFIKISFGIGSGFTTLLIYELSKKNAEIDVTLNELTWFSSYCFAIPIADIFGGFIAQYTSVRRLFMFTFLLYISADLLFYWADSAATILIAQVIVGFSKGLIKGPSYAYIAEVVQPEFRSSAMAIMNLNAIFAKFLVILFGNFIYWRTQILVAVIFPFIGFIFTHFLPDSPQWLASKNRFEDAEKSLARLRGWTTPEAVRAELYSSISNASDSLSCQETTVGNNLHLRKRTKLKNTLSLYLDRSFYVPLLIMICMSFFAEFNGSVALTDFSVLIFDQMKSPIDGHVASTIFSAFSIVCVFVYIFSVRFVGKRVLTLACLFISAVCLTVAITFIYLTNDSQDVTSEIYSWIVTIALITSSFMNTTGINKIVAFLSSEIFPQNLRYVGCGISMFMCDMLAAIIDKIFLYMVEAFTFPGSLIFFTTINIVGFIILYFILPETEGVALQKIEEHYTDSKHLNNKNQQCKTHVNN